MFLPMNMILGIMYLTLMYVLKRAFHQFLWVGKPSENARTINGAELLHHHYNSQFYTKHPSIHESIIKHSK